MSRIILGAKYVNENLNIQFDFTSRLATSETISTKVCTATVYSGQDPSPSSLIAGAASSSGAIVTQKVTGGLLGVMYDLLCSAVTSTGQTLQLSGYLCIVPDLV